MTHHILKTVQPWFDLLWEGSKDWECRVNDRGFLAGDRLYLREWDGEEYLGRLVEADIACVHHDVPGVIKGYVILSLTNISPWERG